MLPSDLLRDKDIKLLDTVRVGVRLLGGSDEEEEKDTNTYIVVRQHDAEPDFDADDGAVEELPKKILFTNELTSD